MIPFEGYVACRGEHQAKETGKMRMEGTNYVLTDSDVLIFLFHV